MSKGKVFNDPTPPTPQEQPTPGDDTETWKANEPSDFPPGQNPFEVESEFSWERDDLENNFPPADEKPVSDLNNEELLMAIETDRAGSQKELEQRGFASIAYVMAFVRIGNDRGQDRLLWYGKHQTLSAYKQSLRIGG